MLTDGPEDYVPTVRDRFAASALAAVIKSVDMSLREYRRTYGDQAIATDEGSARAIAFRAYRIADAMLAERAKATPA